MSKSAYTLSDGQLQALTEHAARFSAAHRALRDAAAECMVDLQEAGVPDSHPAMKEARAILHWASDERIGIGRLIRAAGR